MNIANTLTRVIQKTVNFNVWIMFIRNNIEKPGQNLTFDLVFFNLILFLKLNNKKLYSFEMLHIILY